MFPGMMMFVKLLSLNSRARCLKRVLWEGHGGGEPRLGTENYLLESKWVTPHLRKNVF